jgi:hypothetical protein
MGASFLTGTGLHNMQVKETLRTRTKLLVSFRSGGRQRKRSYLLRIGFLEHEIYGTSLGKNCTYRYVRAHSGKYRVLLGCYRWLILIIIVVVISFRN